ncbi:MAG: hypothetical protein COB53_04800 [Elusimicrobia bacterium]|nr:MAG: hypothetical protein COB53_04800 [Elusimicrobiota bacterium]
MVIATMQREILEVIGSAMHGGAASPLGQRLAEEVQTASRKLKGPMIYRFFSEISFKLGRLLLDGGDVKAARLLLQRCGPTVPVSESELSDVVRDLRRVGEAQTARRLELRNQTGAEDGFRSKFMMA